MAEGDDLLLSGKGAHAEKAQPPRVRLRDTLSGAVMVEVLFLSVCVVCLYVMFS